MIERDPLTALARRHGRYDRKAYEFVLAGLEATVAQLPARRHISGQELLRGLSFYARAAFGPLARFVLNEWGVHRCQDIGQIVFHMVEAGQLSRTDEDAIEDFDCGFDFEEEFERQFDWLAEIRDDIGVRRPG